MVENHCFLCFFSASPHSLLYAVAKVSPSKSVLFTCELFIRSGGLILTYYTFHISLGETCQKHDLHQIKPKENHKLKFNDRHYFS